MDNSVIMCDEVIESDTDVESNVEETKTFPLNFNEKLLYFTCIFINYCSIIDSC